MQFTKTDMVEFANMVATAVVTALKSENMTGATASTTILGNAATKPKISEKSAYAKTESLLYNYKNFKRIVDERMCEIEELRKYGVPQRCGSVGERVQGGSVPSGIVLPEESVENAVRSVQESVQGTVRVLELIDKCMAALRTDPYYAILEMRYFEGRTQEDIAVELGCTQKTISLNKSRLVRELSMRLFPNQFVDEIMN